MMRMIQTDREEKIDWISVILCGWVFFSTVFLTYKMTIFGGNLFDSDYPLHIEYALEDHGYSLLTILIKGLYYLSGNTIPLSIFMGALTAITGVVIRRMLLLLIDKEAQLNKVIKNGITILSYALIFISSIYIPEKAPFYILSDCNGDLIKLEKTYISSYLTQPWHNSTYTAMRCFAILSVVVFLKIWKHKSNVGDYIFLFIALVLTNLFKPNFIIAFAPSVLILAIFDLVKNKGDMIKKILILAGVFIGSMFPLIFQYLVLYSSDEESGISFTTSILSELLNSGYFKWVFITSFAFPILISVLIVMNRKADSALALAWILEFISFSQRTFLLETGPRLFHGNFGWNMMFASLVLFIVCIAKLISICYEKKKIGGIYAVAWGLLIIHLINGFMYFGILLRGISYKC